MPTPVGCWTTRVTWRTTRSKPSPIKAVWWGILALPERVGKGEVGIEDMLKHMDYMINLVGIEHLALGMDFVKYDGPRTLKDRHHPLHKDPMIKGFEEIEDLPNLIDGL